MSYGVSPSSLSSERPEGEAFKPHQHPYSHFAFKTFSLTISWSGKNHGKPQCRASIYEGRTGSHQCSRPGIVQDAGGLWWCGQHSPQAVSDRRAEERAKWEAEGAARKAQMAEIARRRRLADNAERYETALRLIADGHNDPRSLAIETLG